MSLHGVAIALLLVPAVAAAGLALREIRLAGVGYLGNPSLYFSIMACPSAPAFKSHSPVRRSPI
jgi:hypothetical protein